MHSMRILVISDVHSKASIISKFVLKTKPDYIFFLGDGLSSLNAQINNFDNNKIFKVKGNCDLLTDEPTNLIVELENIKFLLTHGHGFNVKNGLVELFEYAKKQNVDFVCFGHTHKPFNESINNIKFFNPGSLGSSRAEENSFGIIEIEDKKITQKIEKF